MTFKRHAYGKIITISRKKYYFKMPQILKSLRKKDQMLDNPRIYLFSSSRLVNALKHEHSCKIIYLLNRLDIFIEWWESFHFIHS